MSMLRRPRVLAVAALVATLSTTGVAAATSASADIYDCIGRCNEIHYWTDGQSSDLWTRTDSGYQQALANMQMNGGGSEVAARAFCDNGAWGIWIQSTIWVSSNTSSSHIDCSSALSGYIGANGAAWR